MTSGGTRDSVETGWPLALSARSTNWPTSPAGMLVETMSELAFAMFEKLRSIVCGLIWCSIAVITHFPTDQTFAGKLESFGENELKFEEHLRDIVHKVNHKKLRLIDGGDVLDRYDGHTGDLIHPGQLGHAVMGENLTRILTEWLSELK